MSQPLTITEQDWLGQQPRNTPIPVRQMPPRFRTILSHILCLDCAALGRQTVWAYVADGRYGREGAWQRID